MRRTAFAAFVAAITLLATGCDQGARLPLLEPALAVTAEAPNPCPDVIGIAALDGITSKYEIVQALYLGIDALFLDARSRNGAKSHVDNIVREICAGDYEAAADFVHNFIQQVEGQPDRMLSPEVPHPEDLIAWVQVLAAELTIVLPEGVVAYTGALSITTGGESAEPVRTRNGHVLVNAADFPPGGSFIVAIAPGPASYAPYPLYEDESYQIVTDGVPDPLGALVAFCGTYPVNLRIAHVKDDGGVEVLDRVDPGTLCDPQESTAGLLDAVPGWLRPLGTLAGATRRLLGPTPLYARAETGLGGRAKSFSPFGVVDPVAPLTVTCVSRLDGTVSVRYGATEICAAGREPVTTVVSVPVGTQTISAQAVGYRKAHDIWFSSGTLNLDPALCPVKWQSGATTEAGCTFTLPPTGGALEIRLTSS